MTATLTLAIGDPPRDMAELVLALRVPLSSPTHVEELCSPAYVAEATGCCFFPQEAEGPALRHKAQGTPSGKFGAGAPPDELFGTWSTAAPTSSPPDSPRAASSGSSPRLPASASAPLSPARPKASSPMLPAAIFAAGRSAGFGPPSQRPSHDEFREPAGLARRAHEGRASLGELALWSSAAPGPAAPARLTLGCERSLSFSDDGESVESWEDGDGDVDARGCTQGYWAVLRDRLARLSPEEIARLGLPPLAEGPTPEGSPMDEADLAVEQRLAEAGALARENQKTASQEYRQRVLMEEWGVGVAAGSPEHAGGCTRRHSQRSGSRETDCGLVPSRGTGGFPMDDSMQSMESPQQ